MAIDLYQSIDGVSGESADANHSGFSDVLSITWGASQSVSLSGGGMGAGKAAFSDLTVTAVIDKATPAILKFCASGKHLANVKISMCKAGGTQLEYATIVLKDALVTSVRVTGLNGAGAVVVNYSYQAAIVEHHYWLQSKDGSKGAEVQMGWDIKQNIATA